MVINSILLLVPAVKNSPSIRDGLLPSICSSLIYCLHTHGYVCARVCSYELFIIRIVWCVCVCFFLSLYIHIRIFLILHDFFAALFSTLSSLLAPDNTCCLFGLHQIFSVVRILLLFFVHLLSSTNFQFY